MDATQELNDLYQNSNSFFYFLRSMKKEGKDVEGALEEETDNWVLLRKMGQKFGGNTWKRS